MSSDFVSFAGIEFAVNKSNVNSKSDETDGSANKREVFKLQSYKTGDGAPICWKIANVGRNKLGRNSVQSLNCIGGHHLQQKTSQFKGQNYTSYTCYPESYSTSANCGLTIPQGNVESFLFTLTNNQTLYATAVYCPKHQQQKCFAMKLGKPGQIICNVGFCGGYLNVSEWLTSKPTFVLSEAEAEMLHRLTSPQLLLSFCQMLSTEEHLTTNAMNEFYENRFNIEGVTFEPDTLLEPGAVAKPKKAPAATAVKRKSKAAEPAPPPPTVDLVSEDEDATSDVCCICLIM